jgi:uridine monophosphate synthetase
VLNQDAKDELALKLHDIGVVKFGDFIFKSGINSPIYLDHRLLATHPKTLKHVAKIYAKLLKDIEYDRLAGIPYAAMPIAGAVSLLLEKSWIYPRKEVKTYGTKSPIEGRYYKGEVVVVLDDLITKGDSKIEALEPLLKEGLVVKDFVVLLDYEKGGSEMLRRKGYRLHSAMTVKELVDSLYKQAAINKEMYKKTKEFLKNN